MKFMKLLKKIFNFSIIIKLRNFFGFKKIDISISKLKEATSISDAFCWRTDNNFFTIFKYSDVLNNFYKIKDTSVIFEFYTKNNELIKTKIINNLFESNILKIDKDFLNGIEDYGIFYIFHKVKTELKQRIIISNRCYLGYSRNNNLPSFVHGNTFAKYGTMYQDKNGTDLVQNTFFSNQIYRVQTFFNDYSKSEIFLTNPTSKKILFKIKNIKYSLSSGNSILIDITNIKDLEIYSNCLFFRPIIFNYKNNFIDVFHS